MYSWLGISCSALAGAVTSAKIMEASSPFRSDTRRAVSHSRSHCSSSFLPRTASQATDNERDSDIVAMQNLANCVGRTLKAQIRMYTVFLRQQRSKRTRDVQDGATERVFTSELLHSWRAARRAKTKGSKFPTLTLFREVPECPYRVGPPF